MQFDFEVAYVDAEDEVTSWGRCVGVAGLFREPMPPTRELLTFAGSVAAGPLAEGGNRLGAMCVEAWNDERPVQWWDLADVAVLARRPHAGDPSLVDIVVEAAVNPDDGSHALLRPARFKLFGGLGASVPYGICTSVNGLYAERPEPSEIPMTLLGCEPAAPMLAALTDGEDEFLLIRARDRAGRSMTGYSLYWRVEQTRPSVLGGTLIDIVLSDGVDEPPPPVARQAWDEWYEGGRPSTPNAWAKYPAEGRKAWLTFGGEPRLVYKGKEADRTAGTYHLDGTYVTDIEGLHCARRSWAPVATSARTGTRSGRTLRAGTEWACRSLLSGTSRRLRARRWRTSSTTWITACRTSRRSWVS
ncbi:hypothetical protein ACFVTP_08865 [Streptomyces celluloflavus]|uniref:hypothetical protein n=1 Tax=Streptomyces celluloflavus TaxID=58344 RepID=UPI0036DE0CA6